MPEDEEPSINFEEIAKELKDKDKKQHIDQIGPALTDVYLSHAKQVDKETGLITFKTKFTEEEADKLADDVFDALGYHSHRRVFGIDKDQYASLAKHKDPNGNSYIDTITQYHFGTSRDLLKKAIGKNKDNFKAGTLEAILKKNIEKHTELLTDGIISKYGLKDAKHMKAVKEAIKKIGNEYKLPKSQMEQFLEITDPNELAQVYASLAGQYSNQEDS